MPPAWPPEHRSALKTAKSLAAMDVRSPPSHNSPRAVETQEKAQPTVAMLSKEPQLNPITGGPNFSEKRLISASNGSSRRPLQWGHLRVVDGSYLGLRRVKE